MKALLVCTKGIHHPWMTCDPVPSCINQLGDFDWSLLEFTCRGARPPMLPVQFLWGSSRPPLDGSWRFPHYQRSSGHLGLSERICVASAHRRY
jgi:hypothetical protein